MCKDVTRLRINASRSPNGAEEYLEYLIDLLKNARTKIVPASQGYETIIVGDTKLLAEIAFLKAEDGVDIDTVEGLPEHMKEYYREELEAVRIPN